MAGLLALALVAVASPAEAAPGVLSYVGGNTTGGNRINHTVGIPGDVQAGDTLVVFLTTNTTNTTINDPAGWTLLETADGNGVRGRAYARQAVAGDAGDPVTITTSGTTKSVMSLAAYRSSVNAASVTDSAISVNNSASSSLTTPAVDVTDENSWVVSYFGEKSSTDGVTFTLPADVTSRTTGGATGSGKVSGVLGDSNGSVALGASLGKTATVSSAASRSVTYSVVVSPGIDAGNQAPSASFTVDCVFLVCNFDASDSSDPNDDELTYSWSWGDGTPAGTGETPNHTYATAGTRTVTLTVSDGELTATATRTAVSTNPPSSDVGTLNLVGADTTQGNRSNHRATIPAGVQVGDTLLLFLTTNSTTSTIANPAGWTLLQSQDGNGIRGRVWTRVAGPQDAGSGVLVTTSAAAKSVMSVAAYHSSAFNSRVTASAGSVGNSSDATLSSPTVPVAEANSWLVNFWAEKSSNTTTWTLPANVTQRGLAASTGTGKVSAALGDSNGAVATGTAASRTANISPASGRNTVFSVVVSPGVQTGNRAPTASFTINCVTLTCSVDAAGSFDLDGDQLTYSWNWGDGTPAGSGREAEHRYASTGTRTVTLTVGDGTTTSSTSAQATTTPAIPGPGHTRIVPETPRTNTPMISEGEIWDIEVLGNRVFVVGGFNSARNTGTSNTTYQQRQIIAFNMDTGLIDPNFRPTITGSLDAVEASPDGTKLFISGAFTAVNGVARQNVASINPATGAVVTGFNLTTTGRVNELAVSNSTVYLGGRFTHVNGSPRTRLAAVNSTTGALVTNFVNDLSGGIGVSGNLGVQRLVLSHDMRRLVVVHTGRQVNGQDRYGVAVINTVTNQLTPWSTRLWQDNLQFVGGIQRAYTADISPDDSYFVVASGSGGDRPPINDTVIRFPLESGANTEAAWISRHFDSIYSVAVTEQGVYAGGHFAWNESPTARDPWPGLDDVGYGTGQGLSGYALGDEVVRREHLGLLSAETGKALEWNPWSNSAEGEKAMIATQRGLIIGGDGQTKGGFNVGRIAFFDFNTFPANNGVNTSIVEPIKGRVTRPNEVLNIHGTASANGGVNRVEVTVFDKARNRYLADNLTTWQTANNTILSTLATPGATSTTWSLPITLTLNNMDVELRARAFANNGAQDATPDIKRIATFDLSDQPPNTNVSGPSGSIIASTSFTITGSATDDIGVQRISLVLQDENNNRYLQDDGSVSTNYHTFNIEPDVVGATSTTWSWDVTVPYEGEWTVRARATDTEGQSDLDTTDRTWLVNTNAVAPTVTINAPVTMLPPTAAQSFTVTPGQPITFSGTASDDEGLNGVEIQLRNSTTGERVSADGAWGTVGQSGWYRISGPSNLPGTTFNWSYTTPFNLTPGSYSFSVQAIDDIGLETTSNMQGRLSFTASIPGDNPPDTRITPSGTINGVTVLHLDLAGTATDAQGVARVEVAIRENDSSRYLQADGRLGGLLYRHLATLSSPNGTSTNWTLSVDLPSEGDYSVTAIAYDTVGQQDPSSSGATSRYPIYPGDQPPAVVLSLMEPASGAVFNDGKIVISGRVEDDRQIAAAEVAVVNAAGQYMSSSGTFTSTSASYRTAFLNSPGSLGSNYSYTTPVIPAGVYRVLVRGVDNHGFRTNPPAESTNITVNTPASNPPVANFTYSCAENVCSFDARSSTDENTATLIYSWNFGNGSGSGPVPTRTYTSANTYTVTLTARDEFNLTSTFSQTITITEPANNVPPVPVINTPSCVNLQCNFSGVGSADPNPGDTFTYRWEWADGTANSTTTSPSHTFPTAGTYVVTLTTTDGWGKAASTTRSVTVTAPPPPAGAV